MSTNQNDPRLEVQKLLAENREHMTQNLISYWHWWAEDMAAAGYDRKEIGNSMLTVAVAQCDKAFGRDDSITMLRMIADLYENLGTTPYPDEPRH